MEETYWKQFMTTGKVEDYLHFKEVSNIEGSVQRQKESGKYEGVKPDAGIGKCDSHCS